MSIHIASPVVDSKGKTRLRDSLERAKRGEGPSVGQWLEFPGYSLARTVASLGEDVSQVPLNGRDVSQLPPPPKACSRIWTHCFFGGGGVLSSLFHVCSGF